MPMAVARASPSRKAVRRQPSAHRMGRAIISTAASTPLAAQLARVSEPMDQKTICCSASAEDWYWISASMAWKKNDSAMPSRIIDSALAPRHMDAPATMVPTYSPQEQAYLDHLKESGVNVDGIEDQLTATGATVCANDPITRDAAAGQLVEQRRTDMDASAVAALLSDTARANLCS